MGILGIALVRGRITLEYFTDLIIRFLKNREQFCTVQDKIRVAHFFQIQLSSVCGNPQLDKYYGTVRNNLEKFKVIMRVMQNHSWVRKDFFFDKISQKIDLLKSLVIKNQIVAIKYSIEVIVNEIATCNEKQLDPNAAIILNKYLDNLLSQIKKESK